MEYDLHSEVKVKTGIAPVAALGASTDSAVIDTLGFESFEWLISLGVITTGTFSMVFEESDVVTFGGEETVVPAANVLGISPTFMSVPCMTMVVPPRQFRSAGFAAKGSAHRAARQSVPSKHVSVRRAAT